jgi:uncharacterized protein (TIGR03083 family)
VADPRTAYASAAGYLVDVAAAVPARAWDEPGLGVWSVRELVGHAGRALTTVPTYLRAPVQRVELPPAVAYFRRALAGPDRDAEIAERGRRAGADLGDDPAAAVRQHAAAALAAVGDAPGGALVATPFGGMRLHDYLQTRVFELVVHGLDVGAATGVRLAPPDDAAAVALHLVAELAAGTTAAGPLLLAATGRGPLPPGFSVLAAAG